MSADTRDPHTMRDVEDLSAAYPTPDPAQSSFDALKERIRSHYELCSDYYYSLGEHIHHGYFLKPEDTKEVAQVQLIELLLQKSELPQASEVLDVGCGIGGTSRYLAKEHGCMVTGITISGQQVQMARRLSRLGVGTPVSSQTASSAGTPVSSNASSIDDAFDHLGKGKVKFQELDAETMGDHFVSSKFDAVWISEAMSHLPNKQLFFENAFKLLKPGGRLVIADWFKAEDLTAAQMESDIKPIEDGMLLPPLCTQQGYVELAHKAGLSILAEPMDISQQVAKTWDISISLVSSPSLWALAFTQGRDFIAFLQAFKAMRRGYANGTFRYAVMAFQK